MREPRQQDTEWGTSGNELDARTQKLTADLDRARTDGTEPYLLQLQRCAGNSQVSRMLVRREPYSEAGAAARAAEIDQQVQANPAMSTVELQRLLQERDRILPLVDHPPAARVTAPPAPPGQPSPVGMPGAISLAAGMMIVPTTGGPPGVPPSVLFGTGTQAAAAETTAVTTAEVGVTTAEAGAAAMEAVAAEATAAEVLATGATAAGGASTIPVAGWIVAGIIVIGVVGYLVYRHYDRVEAPSGAPGGPAVAPPAPGGGPVSAPGAPQGGPVSLPGGQTGPVSLPGQPTGVEQLQVSSADVEDARSRLDRLERSGSLFRDVGNLRDRLGAADEGVRRAAQAELAGLEREAADFDRLRRGEDVGAPRSAPFTEESAFEELMNRYPPPLNQEPYNKWSRQQYSSVRLQPEDLSTEPGEQKRILVIRAPNGKQLRFSVIWRGGVFQDIHESGGPSDRQR
ncbi:hypothetical protein [Actinocrispum wychmicini]|uniref:hypothetical protein n=1 Tax=Actinocrispum wychmicini TaxID=1213861 RepID=UPI0010431748|nr:hypothetical protein [Actinocrispum wychmicini]